MIFSSVNFCLTNDRFETGVNPAIFAAGSGRIGVSKAVLKSTYLHFATKLRVRLAVV